MSSFIVTLSRAIFFRLLAHAPEDLQREAKENARGAIPALCFTEDDIRKKFAQEEQWDELSDDEQRDAIRLLTDAGEYARGHSRRRSHHRSSRALYSRCHARKGGAAGRERRRLKRHPGPVAEAVPLSAKASVSIPKALYRNCALLSSIAPSQSEAEFQAILNLERIRRVTRRAESEDRIGRLAQIYPSINGVQV